MKNKIVVILALAMAMSAANAFAATQATNQIKGFHPTVKVNTYYNKTADAFSSTSAHEQGDKIFWTSNAYGGIAYLSVEPNATNGTSPPAAPNSSTDSATPSGYTTM